MKLPISLVLFFEKIGAIAFMLIPEWLILGLKKLLRGKEDRSKFLSSTAAYFDMRIRKGLNNFDMAAQSANFSFEGKTALEFGTGGHGLDLVLLYLLGTKRIYTVDIKFFGLLNLPLAVRDVEKFIPEIGKQFNLDENRIRERYQIIAGELDVPTILRKMGVTFVTFNDLLKHPELLDHSIEFFFSESNLQRIPLDEIHMLFSRIKSRFADGAVAFHRVDCNDINVQSSRPLYDPKLWNLEYLKYSDGIWKLITTRRFGSQNRLRQAQFIKLFSETGFQPIWIENYYSNQFDVDRIKQFKLDKKFRNIPAENVAVTHFRFVAVHSAQSSNPTEKYFITQGSFPQPMANWSKDMGLMAQ